MITNNKITKENIYISNIKNAEYYHKILKKH